MWLYFYIATGGALGSAGRYFLTSLMSDRFGDFFPYGTLLVNVLGSFAIGWLFYATSANGRFEINEDARQFLMAGICGGFTTFSSFSLQTLLLLRDGAWLRAGGYVVGSVLLCLVFVWLGFFLASGFNSEN